MYDPFELSSLKEIEEIDRQTSQAIESLQISDNSVKCQSCGVAVPILSTLTTKPKNNRIAVLEKFQTFTIGANSGGGIIAFGLPKSK